MRQQLGRLGKNALIYGLGGLLNRFISFLLLPLFTAYLTPADYGISSMLSLVAFFVTPIFSLGLGAAMAPCYFEGNNLARKASTVWTVFTLLATSASVLAFGGVVFARLISELAFQTPEYHYLVTLFLGSTSLSLLALPFILYLQFEERVKLFVTLTAATTLVTIGLNVLMVVVFGRGIQGLIESGLIAQVITLAVLLAPALSKVKFQLSLPVSKELLRVGIPMIPSFAFLFVMQASDRYTLQWFKGLETVGVYTVGYNFGMVMNLFVLAFQNAWLPYFMSFSDKQGEARELFGRITTYYIFGFGTLTLFFFIAAKPIVMLMTQPAFHEAYKVIGLSASAQFFIGIYNMLLPGMYFAKEVHYQALIQSFAAVVTVAISLLLIPPFGLLGAAIALALGYLSMAAFTYLWNLKRRQVYLNVHYEWKRILTFALVYVGFTTVMLWERHYSLSGEFSFSIGAFVLLPVILYTLLTNSEKQVLWSFLNQLKSSRSSRASAKL
jgi:O-antigen/teichoic acid export membrane protein